MKCTKTRDARAKFCLISNPLDFLPFSLQSSSSLLKLPDVPIHTNRFNVALSVGIPSFTRIL